MTTEHGATCANHKMRPDDLLMHHELRFCSMFLPDKGLCKILQGRPEAQGFRKLATLRWPSCKFCQEEEKASVSWSSSIETRIRIGSNSQWIIAVAILRPVQ